MLDTVGENQRVRDVGDEDGNAERRRALMAARQKDEQGNKLVQAQRALREAREAKALQQQLRAAIFTSSQPN